MKYEFIKNYKSIRDKRSGAPFIIERGRVLSEDDMRDHGVFVSTKSLLGRGIIREYDEKKPELPEIETGEIETGEKGKKK